MESLETKVSKADADYNNLVDVTDLCGLRVVTFFSEDVDIIADMIQSEFEIDSANFVDKGAQLDPDQFGYLSLHYVSELKSPRSELPEYARFSGLKFEIQIRSILQHAWAEIEHDWGYKSAVAIPKSVRRRFSRIAGLLELADSEFVGIREELNDYVEQIPERIVSEPQAVLIDQDSLRSFISDSDLVDGLDKQIANVAGLELSETPLTFLEGPINRLHFAGISSIAELEWALKNFGEQLVKFVGNWFISVIGEHQAANPASLVPGVCVLHLGRFMAASSGSIDSLEAYNNLGPTAAKSPNPRASAEKDLEIYYDTVGK